jgi:hypothetical protein
MTSVVSRRSRKPLYAPEPLDAILSRAGESRFARARPPFATALWRIAVGARIADKAHPVWLQDGTLVLRVSTSVWAHELSLLTDDVCSRLRRHGIDVRALRFRVGPLPAIDRPPERRTARTVPPPQAIPQELARTLELMDDDALRDAIERAAASNLAWQTIAGPAPPQRVTEARRAARAPQSAEEETSLRGQASSAARADAPGTRAGGRGRPR